MGALQWIVLRICTVGLIAHHQQVPYCGFPSQERPRTRSAHDRLVIQLSVFTGVVMGAITGALTASMNWQKIHQGSRAWQQVMSRKGLAISQTS